MKQVSYPQSLLHSNKNISTQEYSENKAISSSEESSSISSSDEENQIDLKASNDHCHEPIFVKVNYHKTTQRISGEIHIHFNVPPFKLGSIPDFQTESGP
jgi:hypothetical protein